MRRLSIPQSCSAVLFAFALVGPARANHYTIVDLGEKRNPLAINSHDDVVGAIGEDKVAMIWRGGHWHRVGAGSAVAAINAHGDAAGTLEVYPSFFPAVWPRGGERHVISTPVEGSEGAAVDFHPEVIH